MTDLDKDALRNAHARGDDGMCSWCHDAYPCTIIRLLDDAEYESKRAWRITDKMCQIEEERDNWKQTASAERARAASLERTLKAVRELEPVEPHKIQDEWTRGYRKGALAQHKAVHEALTAADAQSAEDAAFRDLMNGLFGPEPEEGETP